MSIRWGGTAEDRVVDVNGNVVASRRVRFWTARSGTAPSGTEFTGFFSDAALTVPVASVLSDSQGLWGPVYTADTVTALYAGAEALVGGVPSAPTTVTELVPRSVLTEAAASATYVARDDQPPALRPVATNVYYNGDQSPLQTTTGTSRCGHFAAVDCGGVVLGYGNVSNFPAAQKAEADGVNTYTVRAAIETGIGKIIPVMFRGSRTGTVEGGGLLLSDPVGIVLTAGEKFWTRTHISASGTGWVANNRTYHSTGTGGFASGSDLTAADSGAISSGDAYLYTPHLILGTPRDPAAPAVAIIGDSIAAGANESPNNATGTDFGTNGTLIGGFISRALGLTNFGRINIANPSETAYNFVSLGNFRRIAGLVGCNRAIVEYGRNDINNDKTLAQVQAALISTWKLTWLRGMKTWQTTITPETSSSDAYATVNNQTVVNAGREAVRVNVNTWLRAGAPVNTSLVAVAIGTGGALVAGDSGHPLTGVFDVADVAESARNSGQWKAGYTSDGLHPNSTGHAALAAGITTAALL